VATTYAAAPPVPHELIPAPELALVLALQQLLEVTTTMLAALHPELSGDRAGSRARHGRNSVLTGAYDQAEFRAQHRKVYRRLRQ
jgi:hypothetical protein